MGGVDRRLRGCFPRERRGDALAAVQLRIPGAAAAAVSEARGRARRSRPQGSVVRVSDTVRSVEARNRSLPDWFTQIRSGQLRLPRFQRYESWNHNTIGNLLE